MGHLLNPLFWHLVDGHWTIPNDHPQTQLISRNQHQYWSPQNRLVSQGCFNGFWATILGAGNLINPPPPHSDVSYRFKKPSTKVLMESLGTHSGR